MPFIKQEQDYRKLVALKLGSSKDLGLYDCHKIIQKGR